jgi:hypothetical protein
MSITLPFRIAKALRDFILRHRERWALADERERQAKWDEEQKRRRESLERKTNAP